MFDEKEYDSPIGRKFLAKYLNSWLCERKVIFDKLERILIKKLDKIKEEVGIGDAFTEKSNIYGDVIKEIYNEKLNEVNEKYHKIFLEMKNNFIN